MICDLYLGLLAPGPCHSLLKGGCVQAPPASKGKTASLWREVCSVGFLSAPHFLYQSYRACSLSHSSIPAASALGQAGGPSLSSLVLLTEHSCGRLSPAALPFPPWGRPNMPMLFLPAPALLGRHCYAEVKPKPHSALL